MKRFFCVWMFLGSWASGQLTFEKLSQELHAKADDEQQICDFTFENKGSKVEEIESYQGNCSCIAVELSENGKRVYQPGEKGVLRAVFDLGTFKGTAEKHVVMRMKGEAADSPGTLLAVKIHIPVLIQLEPSSVEWDIKEEKLPKRVKVTMNDQVPVKITGVTSSNPNFTAHSVEVVAGREYEVVVTPVAAAQNQAGITMIRIETDCTNERQSKQMAFAIIREGSMAKPESGAAGETSPGPQLRTF